MKYILLLSGTIYHTKILASIYICTLCREICSTLSLQIVTLQIKTNHSVWLTTLYLCIKRSQSYRKNWNGIGKDLTSVIQINQDTRRVLCEKINCVIWHIPFYPCHSPPNIYSSVFSPFFFDRTNDQNNYCIATKTTWWHVNKSESRNQNWHKCLFFVTFCNEIVWYTFQPHRWCKYYRNYSIDKIIQKNSLCKCD